MNTTAAAGQQLARAAAAARCVSRSPSDRSPASAGSAARPTGSGRGRRVSPSWLAHAQQQLEVRLEPRRRRSGSEQLRAQAQAVFGRWPRAGRRATLMSAKRRMMLSSASWNSLDAIAAAVVGGLAGGLGGGEGVREFLRARIDGGDADADRHRQRCRRRCRRRAASAPWRSDFGEGRRLVERRSAAAPRSGRRKCAPPARPAAAACGSARRCCAMTLVADVHAEVVVDDVHAVDVDVQRAPPALRRCRAADSVPCTRCSKAGARQQAGERVVAAGDDRGDAPRQQFAQARLARPEFGHRPAARNSASTPIARSSGRATGRTARGRRGSPSPRLELHVVDDDRLAAICAIDIRWRWARATRLASMACSVVAGAPAPGPSRAR